MEDLFRNMEFFKKEILQFKAGRLGKEIGISVDRIFES